MRCHRHSSNGTPARSHGPWLPPADDDARRDSGRARGGDRRSRAGPVRDCVALRLMSAGARARALDKVAEHLAIDAALLAAPPPAAVALTARQWNAVLEESKLSSALTRLQASFERLTHERTAEGAAISDRLRPAAVDITRVAAQLARMVWQM